MKRSSGYVLVPRGMFTDDPLWLEKRPRTQFEAWLDVVQLAAHEPYDHLTDHGVVHLERGEVLLSRRFMADRWGWSEKVVRRWLESVTKMGRLKAQRKSYDGTVYGVVHYDTYNAPVFGKGQEKGQEKGREKAERRPKIEHLEHLEKREGLPTSGNPTSVPSSTLSLEPSSTSGPPKSPSAVTDTTSGGGSLERLPKEIVDLCYTEWGTRFGATNYARFRQTLLECVDFTSRDHLHEAVKAYAEWYESLSEREKGFNRPAPQKFAAEIARWARLGQMDYSTPRGLTERGLIATTPNTTKGAA